MTFKRVLFVRFSAIGDILLITPLIRIFHNRFPDTQIDILVKKKYVPLLKYHPLINEIIAIAERPSLNELFIIIKKIRFKNYNIIFDLQKHWRSYFISIFSNAKQIFRYKKFSIQRFLLVQFKKNYYHNLPLNIPLRYFLAFRYLDIEWQQRGLELYLSQSEQLELNRKLSNDISNFIVIAPGAGRKTKMWPANYFIELILLIQKEFDIKFILLGGDEDKVVCEEIESSTNKKIINWCGETSLLETAAVLKRCQLVICNDSGIMHMATAFDCKIVTIFGPTVKEFGFFPFSEKYEVMENHRLKCRPCSYHGSDTCPKGHFKCMNELTPEQVFKAVKRMII